MLKYIKKAFLNPWNLLAIAGGVGAAIISGHPDIVLPLLLAGEVAYLGFAATHPKYQKFVDIQEKQAQKQVHSEQNEQVLERIRENLPPDALRRFNSLRHRCRRLRQIASDLKPRNYGDIDSSFDSMQTESLDRLLWVFLRLLFTQHSLQQFLDHTSLERMQHDRDQLESRLKEIDPQDASERNQKVRHDASSLNAAT